MLASLKGLAIKISELYDKMFTDKIFKTFTRAIIFLAAYFIMLELLPDKLRTIIGLLFIAFVLIALVARMVRKKGGKD